MNDATTRENLFDLLLGEVRAMRDRALEAGADPAEVRAELGRRTVSVRKTNRGPAPGDSTWLRT